MTYANTRVTRSTTASDALVIKRGGSVRLESRSGSEKLPMQDRIIEDIFQEYSVLLTIRDHERLKQLVNSNAKTLIQSGRTRRQECATV